MCKWYTGIDPISGKEASIAWNMRGRKLQRALMQFFKPQNYHSARESLIEAGRADLIGGCEGLIPQPADGSDRGAAAAGQKMSSRAG